MRKQPNTKKKVPPKRKPKTPKNPVGPRARAATGRQRKYVNGVIAGKTKKRAARDAGYTARTAEKPQELDHRPAVQTLFAELLEKAGVSDEKLAERIHEGLHATIVVRRTQYARREVLIDFGERREMVELAIRMKGLQPAEKHEHRFTLEDLLAETHEPES